MTTTATPSVVKDRPPGARTVGTVVAKAGLSVEEFGYGPVRQTVFTLTNVAMTITDALAYASQQLYDYPLGRIDVIDAVGTITLTTTSAIASTLNSGVTVAWGVGSAAASATTLATTMMNFIPGSGEAVNTLTSSTTINVASAEDTGILAAVSAAVLGARVDGTATAADLFLNLAVPTGTDIDGDATVTVSGRITVTWINGGTTGITPS